MAEPTPAQQRTLDMLARIDNVLAYIHTVGATRSLWTTPQIEDLLLDIRNYVVELHDLEAASAALGLRIKEVWE